MKAAKEEWIEEQCKNVEKRIMSENSIEAYNILKAFTKIQQHKSTVIEDSSGSILMEITSFLNRWTEYCIGLYSYELHLESSLDSGSGKHSL